MRGYTLINFNKTRFSIWTKNWACAFTVSLAVGIFTCAVAEAGGSTLTPGTVSGTPLSGGTLTSSSLSNNTISNVTSSTGAIAETKTASLSTLFPNVPAATLTLLTNSTQSSDLGSTSLFTPTYNGIVGQNSPCLGFNGGAGCTGVYSGVVNNATSPLSHQMMNKMTIISPSGPYTYAPITVAGGNVSYDKSLVKTNQIGIVDVAYFVASPTQPLQRCDSQIIVCGAGVNNCPTTNPPSCANVGNATNSNTTPTPTPVGATPTPTPVGATPTPTPVGATPNPPSPTPTATPATPTPTATATPASSATPTPTPGAGVCTIALTNVSSINPTTNTSADGSITATATTANGSGSVIMFLSYDGVLAQPLLGGTYGSPAMGAVVPIKGNSGSGYEWKGNNGQSKTFSALQISDVTIIAVDSANTTCYTSKFIRLTPQWSTRTVASGTLGYQFFWTAGEGLGDPTKLNTSMGPLTIPTFSADTPGFYNFTLLNNGQDISSSFPTLAFYCSGSPTVVCAQLASNYLPTTQACLSYSPFPNGATPQTPLTDPAINNVTGMVNWAIIQPTLLGVDSGASYLSGSDQRNMATGSANFAGSIFTNVIYPGGVGPTYKPACATNTCSPGTAPFCP